MKYEAKTEEEAVAGAARALGKQPGELKYIVIRDEKSFWGGRVVEIEVEEGTADRSRPVPESVSSDAGEIEKPPQAQREPRESQRESQPGATDADAIAACESTLTELLAQVPAGSQIAVLTRKEAP